MATEKIIDHPPILYLKILSDRYADVLSVYMHIWEHRDGDNFFSIKKKDIATQTLFERRIFIESIRKICREGLCNIDETFSTLTIELTGWDPEQGDADV